MAEDKKELTIERIFDAPRDLVWQAWTEPELLKKWWGPEGVTNPTCVWEAKTGGEINVVMLAGAELGQLAGQKWPMRGQFEEVEKLKKLVFSSSALDENGEQLLENKVTVTFEDLGKQTKMVLQIVVTKVTDKGAFALQGMEMGWNQSIGKLEKLLRESK